MVDSFDPGATLDRARATEEVYGKLFYDVTYPDLSGGIQTLLSKIEK